MKIIGRLFRSIGSCALLVLLAGFASGAEITITLNNGPQTFMALDQLGGPITIGDVATVQGANAKDHRRIEKLDLEAISGLKTRSITLRQIESRMLIDGFRRHQFKVTGPKTIEVRTANLQDVTAKMEGRLADEIRRQFALDAGSVTVHLMNETAWRAVLSKIDTSKAIPAVFLGTKLPIGRLRIDVEFIDKAGLRLAAKLDVQVAITMDVTLAKTRIQRGTKISPEMVKTIKRPVMQRTNFALQDNVVGAIAKRDIAESEVLLDSHIDTRADQRTSLVKRDDLLDVVVRIGGSEVRLNNARAMAAGNLGDTIAVMNTKTRTRLNAVITGRKVAVIARPGVIR